MAPRKRHTRFGGGARPNLLLALGWVKTRFDHWPFWLPELAVGLPLMLALLWRQVRENTTARARGATGCFCWSSSASRFLNENYLGYILACLVLGALVEARLPDPAAAQGVTE